MEPIIIPQRVTTLTGEDTGEDTLGEIIIITAHCHGLCRHRDHTEGKAGMDWLIPVHLISFVFFVTTV